MLVKLQPQEKARLLEPMLLSREADRREGILIRQGKGWFHIGSTGHEAMSAAAGALGRDDYICPHYRDRALMLARGMDLYDLALCFWGKRASSSWGRQLPGHFSSRKHHVWSMASPTGSNLLPACGIAWGLMLDGQDSVVLACVGDAGMRQGEFYEAVAFAHQMQLPVIFVVEDNGVGISTSTLESNPLRLGLFHKDWVIRADGRSVDAVYGGTVQAVRRVRARRGPCILWVELDRICSHSSSDDQRLYRPAEELEEMTGRDPVELLASDLVEAGLLDAGGWPARVEEARARVEEIYRRAEAAADPGPEDALRETLGEAGTPPEGLSWGEATDRIVDSVNRVFRHHLERDRRVVFFGEDVRDPLGGVFKLTTGLSSDFPDRVFNAPLAEATILGVGCGLASYGMRPVVELQFIDFVGPAWNQLVTNLATLRWRTGGEWTCPLVLYAPYGAYLPAGGPWHSQSNEAAFAHVPGLRVVVPSTPEDAAGLLMTALRAEDPTVFLLPKHLIRARRPARGAVGPVPFGKGRVVRTGEEVTVVAWGNCVEQVEKALEQMGGEISAEVIDLRSIQPWDADLVKASARKTGRLLVVQEDNATASIGQRILAELAQDELCWASLAAPPRLLSRPDVHVGFHPNYETATLPGPREVAVALRELAREGGDLLPAKPVAVERPLAAEGAISAERGTPVIPIQVPAIGEGLEEARILKYFKQPGERVRRDDLIYQLETDKAVVDVEAPGEGVLTSWEAPVNATVPVGAVIGHLQVEAGAVAAAAPGEAVAAVARTEGTARAAPEGAHAVEFEERRLSEQQQVMAGRMSRAARVAVPATVFQKADWSVIQAAREQAREAADSAVMTSFAFAAWAVVRALTKHEVFRSSLPRHSLLRIYKHVHLGMAVALADGDLTTAVLDNADTHTLPEFCRRLRDQVERARKGEDQARQHASVIITSLTALHVLDAIPVIVPPAMATLAVSSPFVECYLQDGVVRERPMVNLSLTIDHRVVNGVGAAAFLNDVKAEIEGFRLPS